jgi:hypothetical protein
MYYNEPSDYSKVKTRNIRGCTYILLLSACYRSVLVSKLAHRLADY